ncbi:hypothetical protein Vafri_9192 [Volvox africanus]|uniref:SET domain-containing protein n=2 Tax=Volvox africanus TaxID=51714 RepID=A0A8J4B5B2_9CHLO|nr:hypothetical protein Vafri_9192 [Volvox africanus]
MGKRHRKHSTGASPSGPAERPGAMRVDRSSLADFDKWMTKAGITWDTSLIQLRAGEQNCDLDGPCHHGNDDMDVDGALPPAQVDATWAVFAVFNVPEGRVLATIPRHAVLSAANSGLADVLVSEQLGGGLALVAAVMYEAARGSKSKWYGYLSSLPPLEYLPVFWSEEELQRLEGTDVADRAKADREAMAADFESELAPLLVRYPKRLGPLSHGWNVAAFMRAASWVASRAFYVDEHHGDALVPLADVFNHKMLISGKNNIGTCGAVTAAVPNHRASGSGRGTERKVPVMMVMVMIIIITITRWQRRRRT